MGTMSSTTKKTRMTIQRRIILEEVKKVKSHPTADEVHSLVRKKIPKISLGTIYRNLERMTEDSQIRRLEWSGTQRRYDGNLSDHHHLRCLICGEVEDVAVRPWPKLEEALARETRYEIVGYRLEFSGVCPACGPRPPTSS